MSRCDESVGGIVTCCFSNQWRVAYDAHAQRGSKLSDSILVPLGYTRKRRHVVRRCIALVLASSASLAPAVLMWVEQHSKLQMV